MKPRWGQVALGGIKPTAVQKWISDLGRGTQEVKPLGASAVKRAHYVLSQILGDAVRDRLIVANPAAGIALPRTSRKRPVYLTHSQVAALASASGDYEGLVLFLAYTGLRWGEGVGLRVRDLDLLRKRATIAENAVQSGKQIFVGTSEGSQTAHRATPGVSAAASGASVRAQGPRRPVVVHRRRRPLEAASPGIGMVREGGC